MNVEEYELTSQRVIVQVIGFFFFFLDLNELMNNI